MIVIVKTTLRGTGLIQYRDSICMKSLQLLHAVIACISWKDLAPNPLTESHHRTPSFP